MVLILLRIALDSCLERVSAMMVDGVVIRRLLLLIRHGSHAFEALPLVDRHRNIEALAGSLHDYMADTGCLRRRNPRLPTEAVGPPFRMMEATKP